MDVLTTNPILLDSDVVEEDYMDATGMRRRGKRRIPRTRSRSSAPRTRSRSSAPRRKRRTGLNKLIGYYPPVAIARNIQANRERKRAMKERQQQRPSQSRPKRRQRGRRPDNRRIPNANQNLINSVNERPVGKGSSEAAKTSTLSKNKKIALVVGGLLLFGIGFYLYSKRKK